MTYFPIKPTGVQESSGQSISGPERDAPLSRLSATFTDLLQKAGKNLGNSLNAITDRAGFTAVLERDEPLGHGDEFTRDHWEDSRERVGESGRGDERDHARRDDHRPERDDYAHDRAPERRDERDVVRADDRYLDRADAPGDRASHRDDASNRSDRAGESRREGESQETGHETARGGESTSDGQVASGQGSEGGGETLANGADGAAAQSGSARNAHELMKSGLVPGLELAAATAQVAEVGVERAQQVSQGAHAAESLAGVAERQGQRSLRDGQHAAPNRADAQARSPEAGAKDGLEAQLKAESGRSDNKGVERQAAALSRTLGDGQRLALNVSVTDEARSLVSKPASSLAPSSVIASEPGGSQQGGQHSTAAPTHNPVNPALAAGQQAAGGKAQAQQTGAQIAQAQTGAGAGTAAGPVQGAAVNSGPQTAHSGGGESASTNAPGGSNESEQVRESAQPKSAEGQRTPAFRHAVAEQVSVRIMKAVSAGNDRINIQLRPPELGRVEVRLEVAQDGRVFAAVTADNKDTLELLRRDASELQKALQDAGLHADAGNMSFNLRGGQGGEAPEDDGHGSGLLQADAEDDENDVAVDSPEAETGTPQLVGVRGLAGVDVHA